ncbi:SH3 domain-containing protein [Leptospira saintgironsiae]|uniref:SH3b domain-containing protein n=1 Tax=Leptospira saintgironsiae TaxID=2023183 RepID=A0A2M9YA89_9LEPT|nr:SH3 domain-containing protein [Leptospira saintgironsiae]PJZ48485.1 hypothetical protein CH362_14890 [Leptospira saintgironsiae]
MRILKHLLKSIVFVSILGNIYCSEPKQLAIGEGFVLKDGVCLHETPSAKSKCLDSLSNGNRFEILNKGKFDKEKGEYSLWFEVRIDGKEGYINQNEEIFKSDIITIIHDSFSPLRYTGKQKLNLVSVPSIKGDVIEVLPENTEIDIIGGSLFKYEIEGKIASWGKIKTRSGKIGYVFLGFTVGSNYKPYDFDENRDEVESYSGLYIPNAAHPVFWIDPGVEKGTDEKCEKLNLKGESSDRLKYFKVTSLTTHMNIRYFQIEKDFYTYYWDHREKRGCISAWVSEKDGIYSEYDLFSWSSAKYGSKYDLRLINLLSSEFMTPLQDVSSLKITELPRKNTKSPNLFKVTYNIYDEGYDKEKVHSALYSKKNGIFSLALPWMGARQELVDINNDGIDEWVVTNANYVLYYAFDGSIFNKVLEWNKENACDITINERDQVAIEEDEENKNIKCNIYLSQNNLNIKAGKEKIAYKLIDGKLISGSGSE